MNFSPANAKLKALEVGRGKLVSFSLASGYSCPMALECKSKAVVGANGKRTVKDAASCVFRCFSASQEAMYTATFDQRMSNLKKCKALAKKGAQHCAEAILNAIPKKTAIIRVHVGGDFFSPEYFRAWCEVAKARPDVLVYAYTKSVSYVIANAEHIPDNFSITLSRGGTEDHLIEDAPFKSAHVVFSYEEAEYKGLEIDHDDSLAAFGTKDFALLIHGGQPKGSDAGKAIRTMKTKGEKVGYTR